MKKMYLHNVDILEKFLKDWVLTAEKDEVLFYSMKNLHLHNGQKVGKTERC